MKQLKNDLLTALLLLVALHFVHIVFSFLGWRVVRFRRIRRNNTTNIYITCGLGNRNPNRNSRDSLLLMLRNELLPLRSIVFVIVRHILKVWIFYNIFNYFKFYKFRPNKIIDN